MNLDEVLRCLLERKFVRLWKGKELESFQHFLRSQVIPSRGFALSLDGLKEGGVMWFFYRIEGLQGTKVFFKSPRILTWRDRTSREIPEQIKGFPVWRLNFEDIL